MPGPARADGSRHESFKVSQRDPSTPLGMTWIKNEKLLAREI
jgi:hypothetical protein